MVIILIALTFLIFGGKFIEKFAMSTGGPVAAVYTSFKDEILFVRAFIGSRASLIEKNRRLENILAENQAKMIRFDSLFQEHQTLLEAYSRSPFAGSVVLANVIAKPPQSPYDILLVDVGSSSNISLGSRVYGLGGIPLGRIGETTDSQAKVVLFSSVGEDNQAIIERTGATVTLEGIGGGNMESEVGQDLDIVVGDKILLPQFNGALVATVVEVDKTATSAYKKVLYRTPINIFHLRFVEIVKAP
ncbi:MAG TPA: rod shape-determining protein MreC [Candidatus Nanoarchaeia archaeon]|nr:rod shape-determining protein MreC [Candidatus Nanoarchaeia archaeon]